jgi:hypothetical protein
MIKSLAYRYLGFVMVALAFISCNQPETKKAETTFDIYKCYKDKGVAKIFAVPPGIASIFLDDKRIGNAELKDLLKDIKHLSFLIIPNTCETENNNYFADINLRFDNIMFKDLATINNGNEIVNVKILRGDESNVDEMIVIVSNSEALFCISFMGDINPTKISNLTKPKNLDALANLNRFKL